MNVLQSLRDAELSEACERWKDVLREDSVGWCWETSNVLETVNGICIDIYIFFLLLWFLYVDFSISS